MKFKKLAALEAVMPTFMERIRECEAASRAHDADPLRATVEATVRGMDAVSTVALLDLIGLPRTTGNGRQLAQTMRALGFIPIKSRRLMPGGYRDTVTRGWTRPVRKLANSISSHEPNIGAEEDQPARGLT